MVKIDRIRDDREKRILRCYEGNRVWYQLGINPGERIELFLEGGSRTGMIELQMRCIMFSFMRRRMVGGS